MQKLVILAFDGVFDSSLAVTSDAIAAANRVSELSSGRTLFDATLFSPGKTEISTRNGGRYRTKSRLVGHSGVALIIPGLGLQDEREIEKFLSSQATKKTIRWLSNHAVDFPLVGASCSAVFPLAEAGLLEGKTATTTWWLAPLFRKRYPSVDLDETRMVTECGGFLCAGAALAQMDLMLHLIARLGGPEIATRVAGVLAIDQRPSQSRYMMSSALMGLNDDVVRAERWVLNNLGRPFSVAEMAGALGMSSRTLDRRLRVTLGVGPSKFAQRLRGQLATHLIETTDQSLEEIAATIGYADTASLRRVIKREWNTNPSELRGGRLANRNVSD